MPSAEEHPKVISEYLASECREGRVLGPMDPGQFSDVHRSQFGVVPKGTPGKWRLIVDLSSPEGKSVNDGVSIPRCSLAYVRVEDAVQGVAAMGRGSLMAKVDICQAYRAVPVHPADRDLLGMIWQGKLFIDAALPFGLRSAPKIFTAVADAVTWIIRQQGVRFIIHYLDDFLLIGPPGHDDCAVALAILLQTFDLLGLPVAWEKLEGPTACLTFLGLEIDSATLELRLPREKLWELQQTVSSWLDRTDCRKKELESLHGQLAYASKVVKPGKTFTRCLIELLAGFRKSYYHIRLNEEFKADLMWWMTFMSSWNGMAIITPTEQGRREHHIWTDASGSFGCGAVAPSQEEWLQWRWSNCTPDGAESVEESILWMELFPIVLATAVWGRRWEESNVIIHCDNMGTVAVVNSGYSKAAPVMYLLRCLFFARARFQFTLQAVHTPGVQNTWADAVSRNNISWFLSQVPNVGRVHQTAIPRSLAALLLDQHIDWRSESWTQRFSSCL